MQIHPFVPTAAAALVLLLSSAVAEPTTDHFEPLLGEMNERELALGGADAGRQEKALLKGFRILSKESRGLSDDIKWAPKLEKALSRGWPGDEELDGLFTDLSEGLTGEVESASSTLGAILEALAPGKAHDKVLQRLEKGDAFLASAGGETNRARSLKWASKALKQYYKGEKIALKANPAPPSGSSFVTATVQAQAWASNDTFGPGVSGQVGISIASGGIRRLLVRGRHIFPAEGPPPPNSPPGADLPGVENILEISMVGVSADIAPGTYFIGNTNGVTLNATWTVIDEDDNVTTFLATSGSVTIDAVAATLGSGSAEGSFGFTVEDLIGESSVTLAGGAFEAFDLQRATVE